MKRPVARLGCIFTQTLDSMKNSVLLLALLILSSCNSSKQDKKDDEDRMTTFYFIRHAEKRTDQGNDPELTEKGAERAAQWVNYFFLKELDVVLSSDFERTRATAEPLATSKKMNIITYDAKTLTGAELLKKYKGKTVALFGHSNTINEYTNQFQNDSIYAPLNDADYDHYFQVRVDPSGKSSGVLEVMPFVNE